MAINKRYYWLKLREDFFQDEAISWLEEQENGKLYSLFYLKLCLKSINNNGVLVRQVGDMLIPYDAKKLGEITNTPKDTVIVALELLKRIGLVKILDNGELYLNQVQYMIGSETESTRRSRKSREKKKQQISNNLDKNIPLLQCNKISNKNATADIEIDIDKDIEIDIDKDIEIDIDKDSRRIISTTATDLQKKEVIDIYMNNINYSINSIEYERLIDDIDEYGVEWVKEAITRAVMQGKRKLGYIEAILNNWKVNGYDEYKTKNKVNTSSSSKLSDAEQLALNRAPKSLLDEFLEQEGIKKNG